MAIEVIDDKEMWDSFVDKSPYGLISHKWDFLKIAQKYTEYELLPYGIYNKKELIALFPLFYKKNKGLKSIFSPPPGSSIPYLGFVMRSDYDDQKEDKKETYLEILEEEIRSEIDKISPNYVSISTVPNFSDIRFFKWDGYEIEPYYTYAIDISEPLEQIFSNFKMNLRKQLKKADSADLELVRGDDFSPLYEILVERYREQGLNFTIDDKNYIEELLKTYPDNIRLYYLYDEDKEIIGGQITQEYKQRLSLWIGSPKTEKSKYGTEYMIWKLIQKAKDDGHTRFEMTGANTKHLCKFKSKFNPSLEMNYKVSRSDRIGKVAEYAYLNLYKKRRF